MCYGLGVTGIFTASNVHRRRGLNLLEMVLALFIFSSIMVALFNMWGFHARALASTRNQMVASFILSQKLEESVALGWTATSQAPAAVTVTHTAKGQDVPVEYWTQVDVADQSAGGVVGLKSITVRVWWEDTGHHELESTAAIFWQS